MTEPTDADIFVVAREAGLLPDNSHPAPETRATRRQTDAVQAFARAVLAKWGTPPAVVGEVASLVQAAQAFVLDPTSLHKKLTLEAQAWGPLASLPQPTQAGAVPMPRRTLLDMTQCYSDRETFGRAVEAWHGIKGGQHGAE